MKQFAAPNEQYPAFKLRKMEFLPQLNGMTFAQIQASLMDSEYADTLLAQPVRTIVLRGWKRPEVLYQVFVRLNQNSVSLSPQELRQALFPGAFTTWINERSANSNPVHRARRIKREDFRMRDAEMLLRSIAFADRLEDYNGNLRQFLDDQCERGLDQWQARQDEFASLADETETAILRTFEVFSEEKSFLRFADETYIRRFNIAVYDVMVAVFGSRELSDATIAEHKDELRSAFEFMCREDPRFSLSLTSSTKTTEATGYRISKFAEAVGQITGTHLAIQDRAARLVQK